MTSSIDPIDPFILHGFNTDRLRTTKVNNHFPINKNTGSFQMPVRLVSNSLNSSSLQSPINKLSSHSDPSPPSLFHFHSSQGYSQQHGINPCNIRNPSPVGCDNSQLTEWQEGLKALLPNVNVRFVPNMNVSSTF